MPTWTEILGEAARAVENVAPVRFVPAADLRELLLDLPHHPNLGAVRSVTVEVGDQRAIILAVPPGEAMSSGASGPILPNAAEDRGSVQPWRVTPVLGDAGAPSAPVVARARLVEDVHGSSMPVGAGWFEGLRPWPEVTTKSAKPDAMDRLIILPGDA